MNTDKVVTVKSRQQGLGHLPTQAQQSGLKLLQRAPKVSLRLQAHGRNLHQDSMDAGADHCVQQVNLWLSPHKCQRHQPQPCTYLQC